jgi:uncharacterized repeat protein (TIGR01451 family)
VWMTGYLDGACPPDEPECGSYGKVSYLGGHEYKTDLPISANPDTQGTRLFLNSLFEAPCATLDGLPSLNLAIAAPAFTMVPTIEVDVVFVNPSNATALDAVLRATLPPDTSFVSATDGGQFMAGEVVWQLGNLGADEGGERSFMIDLDGGFGLYDSVAALDYRVGLNDFSLPSNVVQTLYGDEPPGDGDGDGDPGDGDGDPGDGDGDSGGATSEDGNEQGESAGDDGTADETGGEGGALDAGDRGCACTTNERESTSLGWLLLAGLGLVRRRGGAA